MTETETIGGKTWYYKEVSIDNATELVNVIFNNGSGTDKLQTVDITAFQGTGGALQSASVLPTGGGYAVR